MIFIRIQKYIGKVIGCGCNKMNIGIKKYSFYYIKERLIQVKIRYKKKHNLH